jgi:predicted nucleic acid-binding protein
MIAVIDVSAAMEILLHRKKADKFSKVLQESTLTIAPDLYVSELTNSLWKYCTAKILTQDECIKYVQDGLDYIDKFVDCKELWPEAFAEGIKNNHSIYDMFYLVAARRNNGILLTNDSDLAALCKKNHVQLCC